LLKGVKVQILLPVLCRDGGMADTNNWLVNLKLHSVSSAKADPNRSSLWP